MLKYKRILLKISGEALLGKQEYGISQEPVEMIANEIKEALESLGLDLLSETGHDGHGDNDDRDAQSNAYHTYGASSGILFPRYPAHPPV